MRLSFLNISELGKNNAEDLHPNIKSLLLFSAYYKEYYKKKFMDLSCIIMVDGEVLGHMLCCVLDEKLMSPDGGAIIKLYGNPSSIMQKKIYADVLNYLKILSETHNCKGIIIKDAFRIGSLSPLGEQLFNRKFHARLTFEMKVDYSTFSQSNYHESLRKSYKSLINWGRENLEIIYLNKDNYNLDEFKSFQEFHIHISGRKTRSDESWLAQYAMIREGFGELSLARYKNELVAGAFFADYGDTSIYFTGVNKRDLFEFGLSHFLLYDGISRSYKRENTSTFSAGYFDTDIKDSKLYNIQFFKKGFCKDLKPTIFWSGEVCS